MSGPVSPSNGASHLLLRLLRCGPPGRSPLSPCARNLTRPGLPKASVRPPPSPTAPLGLRSGHPLLEQPVCSAGALVAFGGGGPAQGNKDTDPQARSAEGCPLQEPVSPH